MPIGECAPHAAASACATLSVAQDSNCTAEPTLELPLDTTMGGNLDIEGTLTVRGVDVSGGGGPTVETVDARNLATTGGVTLQNLPSVGQGGHSWGYPPTWQKSITLTEEKTVMAYYSVTWQCYWSATSPLGNVGSLNLLTTLRITGGAPAMTPIYAAKSFQGRAIYPQRPLKKGVGPWAGTDTVYGVQEAAGYGGNSVELWNMDFGGTYGTNTGMWTGTLPAGTYSMQVLYQGYLATAMNNCFNDDSFYMNIVIF